MKKSIYNILLITGLVTSEHDPKVNYMLRALLQSTGRFKVKITEEFSGATEETLNKYDAVIVNYDGKEAVDTPYIGWGENAERALYSYTANGGGVIMYHSSIIKGNPALPEEFVNLIGYEFDFNKGCRKSPKLEFTVNYTDNHDITKGLVKTWTTPCDDLFVNMRPVPGSNVTVLATVFDALEDYDYGKMQKHLIASFEGTDFAAMPGVNAYAPVIWTNTYGKGHVVSIFIGHGPDTIRRPPFVAMLARAAEWVSSGEVTIEAPDLNGLNRLRAWPYYSDLTVQDYAALTEY